MSSVLKIKFLILLSAFVVSAKAQTTISGRLISSDNSVPDGVSILLHKHNDKNDIIAFEFSNSKGEFNFKYTSAYDSVAISTHSISYADTTIILLNQNQKIQIPLKTQVFKLKEVRAEGVPILSEGDTTKYIVGAFEKPSDQNIGDVINRMPGFAVDTDGKITYMGKEIDKYYIEGMDLLEGRYAIANKNLSNKAVGSVEVLHNHQPIKMFRKRVFHDGTSINLKLKNKYTATYRTSATAGIPWLSYDANFSPMLFAPNNQMIATLQSNNLGNDLQSQFIPFAFSLNQMGMNNRKYNLLEISSVSPSVISNRQRYLLNNAYLASFNYLSKISEDEEIKTNISYYNDYIKEDAIVSSEYYLPTDTVKLSENTSNRFGKNSAIVDIIYNNNAADKYVNNKFRIENYSDKNSSAINQTQQAQLAKAPHLSLSNEMDWNRLFGEHFVSLHNFVDYNNAPQSMDYTPAVFSNIVGNDSLHTQTTQFVDKQDIQAMLSAAFTLRAKRWQFGTKLYADYNYSHYNTNIATDNTIIDADSLRNSLEYGIAQFGVEEKISYKTQQLQFNMTIPLSLANYNINDKCHNANMLITQTQFMPRAYVNYKFRNFFTASASLLYRQNMGNPDNLTQGYIISNYRTLMRQSAFLPKNKSSYASARLEYKNPLSGWFASAAYTHSTNTSNLTMSSESLGNGVFSTQAIEQNNTNFSNNLNAEITYYLSELQANITVKTNYIVAQSQYILNNTLSDNKNTINSYGANFDMGYLRWLILKYNYTCSFINQETTQASSQITNEAHIAQLGFVPNYKHLINLTLEYSTVHGSATNANAFFGDLVYTFKPSRGKFSYKFMLQNFLNAKTITQFSQTDFSLVRNTYNLRPRQILVSVMYKM